MRNKDQVTKAEYDIVHAILRLQPATVKEIQEALEPVLGLARTTVLTHMERLRQKGVLIREAVAGVNHYSVAKGKEALFGKLITNFVDQALGGEITPLAAFLSGSKELTDEERVVLEKLVERLSKAEESQS